MSAALASTVHSRLASPTTPAAHQDYWLAHCEGFRVDGDGGRLGFVEEVRGPSTPFEAGLLGVRAGMLGRRVLLVPIEEVAYIVPRAKTIWLKSSARIAGSEPRRR
ncbi:MAG: hypothetical protein ACXVRI_10090 [Gaiellaceae bacterium]